MHHHTLPPPIKAWVIPWSYMLRHDLIRGITHAMCTVPGFPQIFLSAFGSYLSGVLLFPWHFQNFALDKLRVLKEKCIDFRYLTIGSLNPGACCVKGRKFNHSWVTYYNSLRDWAESGISPKVKTVLWLSPLSNYDHLSWIEGKCIKDVTLILFWEISN